MKVIKYQLLLAAALLADVAIGFFTAGNGVRTEDAASAEQVEKASLKDEGETASLKALRKRIAELEKALSEKSEQSEMAISNAVAETMKNAAAEPRRPRGNPRKWLEDLKKTDPARYAQVTNNFAQWRQRREEQVRSKIDFFSSIDTSRMSASARKTHNALQELIVRRAEIEDQLAQEDLSNEARDTLMREMRDTHRELQRLNGEERKNLIEETAKSLGFEGEDVQEISSTIQDVIQATDSWGGGRRHGPRPGGPGGPNGR